MATLRIDLVDGNRGRFTANGWENVTRTALVYGLGGVSSAKLETAINHASMPAIGDPHPSLTGIYLNAIVPESVSATVVKMTLEYGAREDLDEPDPDYVNAEFGSSVSSYETSTDKDGNALTVSWKDTSVTPNVTHSQTATTSFFKPETTIRYIRKEASNPGIKSKQYAGKVNSGPWSLDGSCVAKEWLCTGITGDTRDSGATWDVVYNFIYRKYSSEFPGWDAVCYYIDPATGRPPADFKTNTADPVHTYQIYEEIDFDGLLL